MTGLRYSPLHVTELCEEMQGNFKVGCARLTSPGKKKEVRSTDKRCVPLLLEVVQDAEVPCYCADCHKGLRYNEN